MAGDIDISPGGTRVGWIGNDPAGTGLTGAWLKKVWIGGTSPGTAPFQADASGTVAMNNVPLTLNQGGYTTTLNNAYDSDLGANLWLKVDAGTGYKSGVHALGFTAVKCNRPRSLPSCQAMFLKLSSLGAEGYAVV